MAQTKKDAWLAALTAYSEKFEQLLELRHLSESQLGRDLKARKTPVNTKTLNNIGNVAHPTKLDNLAAVADYFGLPLWVMFLPGMPKSMLDRPSSERLIKMMADYMECEDADRLEVEGLASIYAEKKRRSK